MSHSDQVSGPTLGPPDLRRLARVACAARVVAAVGGLALAGPGIDALADEYRATGRTGTSIPFVGPTSGPAIFGSLAGLAALVLTMVVTWRLVKAGEWLGRRDPRWGPGWAIGGRLIPFGSAVIPGLQLGELWRATDPELPPSDARWQELGERTRLAGVLVAVDVAQNVLIAISAGAAAFAAARRSGGRAAIADDLRATKPWVIAGSTVGLVSACLTAYLLVRLADRQHASLDRNRDRLRPPTGGSVPGWPAGVPLAPAWPPGWYPDPSGRFPMRWWDGWAWSSSVWTGSAAADDPPPAPPPPGG